MEPFGYEKSSDLTSTTEWVYVCVAVLMAMPEELRVNVDKDGMEILLEHLEYTYAAMVARINAKRDQLAGSNQCECTQKNSGCRNV